MGKHQERRIAAFLIENAKKSVSYMAPIPDTSPSSLWAGHAGTPGGRDGSMHREWPGPNESGCRDQERARHGRAVAGAPIRKLVAQLPPRLFSRSATCPSR